MTNAMVTVNGDWTFERNQVCVGGSLAFIQTKVDFNGSLYFNENKGISEINKSTAGLLLKQDTLLNLTGTIESVRNKGFVTSFLCITSQLYITDGAFILRNNSFSSFRAVSLQKDSKLVIINGSLVVHNNILRHTVILCEVSIISVSGNISIINNNRNPIVAYNSIIRLGDQIDFEDNAGVLFASKTYITISGNSTFTHNSVEDDFTDGTIAILESCLIMEGMYTFKDADYDDENGGGISATTTSTVILSGTGYFINNKANYGGGIFIDQQSRLELQKGTRLHFMNNTAVKGAAIFIGTSVQHAQCQYNPNECLFGLEDDNDPDVSLTFQHNKAYPGASVIHVNFDHIENRDIEYSALDALNSTVDSEQSSFIGNSGPHYSSDTYWFCFCVDNNPENCIRNDSIKSITAYKGKPFTIRARVLKFYGSTMPEPVRANLESALNAVDKKTMVKSSLTANNGILQSVSATECSNFSFTVTSPAANEVMIMNHSMWEKVF